MFLLQAGGIAVALALSVVLARTLGLKGFGIYSYALSIATLISVPVQLGLPTLVVRDTARLKQAQETRQMHRLWLWTTIAVLLASVIIIVPVLLASPMIFSVEIGPSVVIIIFGLVLLMSLSALRAAALRGLGHVIQGQLPEMVFRPALTLVLVFVAIVLSDTENIHASSALLMNLIATALTFSVGIILLRRVAPPSTNGCAPQTLHRDWLRAGFVLGLASSAMVINRNLDIAMLGSLRVTTEVGLYKVAVSLSMLCATAMTVLRLALQPRIAALHAAEKIEEMRALTSSASRISFAASALFTLFFYVFGRELIEIAFGQEFSSAYEITLILILGQLANTFFGPVMMLLNMTGQEKTVMWSVIHAAAGNILLNLFLIPPYGTTGAAIATASTLLTWNLVLNIQSIKKLGIDSSILGIHNGFKRQ